MLKRLGVVIPSTILTLLMAVGFSTPVFAYVDTTEVAEEPVQVIEEAEPTEEEKIPFTIAGNGEVEDNMVDDPSKEFFTVKTKDGNTFFLVIDRARNSENVYMLSMIDEYDLQEFLDDEERNGKQEEETPAVVLPETKPEPTPDVEIEEPKEESSGGMNKILLLVFVAALGGAGAFFYFYIYKPKPKEETPQSENLETDQSLTTVNEDNQSANFTAKYKDVLQPGYTAKPVPFAEPEKDKDVPLPKKMEQGMVLPVVRAEKKQGFTSPPKVYTEDTLLSAMETAGNKEFEKDTEKKGLGTPATRAAILEKLVSSGYVERKGKQMIPTEDGVAAIRNIPDYLKSASMTAEWENDLLRMERGEIKPHDFMQGIHGLIDKMLADLRQIPTVAAAPHHNKVSVGSCPVCGNSVHESKLSFCCADRSCKFALWKESRYLSNMRKTLDKKMAVDLLKKGRTHVKDFYSAKKDKTFAADLVMRVEEGRAQYSLEFPKALMKKKT